MKRAETSALELLIDIVLMLLILSPIIFLVYTTFSGPPVNDLHTRVAFDEFTQYYTSCVEQPVTDCYCYPPLNMKEMNEQSFIHLVPVESGHLRAYLKGRGETIDEDETFDQTALLPLPKSLCTLDFNVYTQKFTINTAYDFFFPHFSAYREKQLVIYLTKDKQPCFLNYYVPRDLNTEPDYVYPPFSYEAVLNGDYLISNTQLLKKLPQHKPTCEQRKQQPLTHIPEDFSIFIHMRQSYDNDDYDAQNFALIESLQRAITLQGVTKQPFTGGYLANTRSKSFFPYNIPQLFSSGTDNTNAWLEYHGKDLKQPFAPKTLIISTKADYDEKAIADYYRIYYLAKSNSSKIFAAFVQQELNKLYGLYYSGDIKLTKTEAGPHHLINAQARELISVTDEEAFFLTQPSTYKPFYEQRYTLPAVFIDFVETDDGHNLLAEHETILAQAIATATKNYLQKRETELVALKEELAKDLQKTLDKFLKEDKK